MLTFWLTASASLLRVVTAESSPISLSLKSLNFHHRKFPGYISTEFINKHETLHQTGNFRTPPVVKKTKKKVSLWTAVP